MRWMLVLGLATGLGCSASSPSGNGEEGAATPTPTEQNASVESNFDRTPALSKADLADGIEDKVAMQCAGCALAMEGDPAHTIQVDGYELHMCAGACKDSFEADLDSNLSSLIQ